MIYIQNTTIRIAKSEIYLGNAGNNLVNLVKIGGRLYISFPIGKQDEVHFNAHRVFHPKSILALESIADNMNLVRFDYVDDNGDLHLNTSVDSAVGKTKHGCGIYTFVRL
jgi:hypothetical protein